MKPLFRSSSGKVGINLIKDKDDDRWKKFQF